MCSSIFTVCLIVAVFVIKESHSFCGTFDKDSGIAQLCGYRATVNFTHQSHYEEAVSNVKRISARFSTCSDYAKLIVCSVFTPRCESYIEGPYLPCRRVCDEFNRQCSDRILKYGMEWIIGMCQLLPRKDDPNTTRGYLGRCFEPPNFKTNLTESSTLTCNKLIVPACQNLGYTHTVLSEKRQKALASWATDKLKDKVHEVACDVPRRKLFCTQTFIPCIDNKAGSFCRPKCETFFGMNCTAVDPSSNDNTLCMELPKGSSYNDICIYTDWPKALNWPQVRKQQTVISSTTVAPKTTDRNHVFTTPPDGESNKPTSTQIKDQKTDSRPNVEGSTKPKMAVIVGSVFGVLLFIIIILIIVIVVSGRRRRKSRNSFPHLEGRERTTRKLLT